MAWLTGSVQGTLFGYWPLFLFSCTFPAPLVPRGLKAAQLPSTFWVCPNLPFLSFSLRSSSFFGLSFGWLGSRQPGLMQGVGLGSRIGELNKCISSHEERSGYIVLRPFIRKLPPSLHLFCRDPSPF